MKPFQVLTFLCAGLVQGANAQSFCSSDGQAPPTRLVERFISADCESCWSTVAAAESRSPRTLTLDWIVPSPQGDEAPLSAAASRDALRRLEALEQAAPSTASFSRRTAATAGTSRLRVAHGVAINDYIAASIEMKPAAPGPWRTWLLLVETIPGGTEGTPIARNLVRNLFSTTWQAQDRQWPSKQSRFFDMRPMAIPQGAQPKRLRVIGWVEDAQGRIRLMAQSHCTPTGQPE